MTSNPSSSIVSVHHYASSQTRHSLLGVTWSVALLLIIVATASPSQWLQYYVRLTAYPVLFFCTGAIAAPFLDHQKKTYYLKKLVRHVYLSYIKWAFFFILLAQLVLFIAKGDLSFSFYDRLSDMLQAFCTACSQMTFPASFVSKSLWLFRVIFFSGLFLTALHSLFTYLRQQRAYKGHIGGGILCFSLLLLFLQQAFQLTVIPVPHGGAEEIRGLIFATLGYLFIHEDLLKRLTSPQNHILSRLHFRAFYNPQADGTRYHLHLSLAYYITSFLILLLAGLLVHLFPFYTLPSSSIYSNIGYMLLASISLLSFNILSHFIVVRVPVLCRFLLRITQQSTPILILHPLSMVVVQLIVFYLFGGVDTTALHTISYPASFQWLYFLLLIIAGIFLPLLFIRFTHFIAVRLRINSLEGLSRLLLKILQLIMGIILAILHLLFSILVGIKKRIVKFFTDIIALCKVIIKNSSVKSDD